MGLTDKNYYMWEKKKKNKTLPYFLWASLVTQLIKNPPAIRETWVQSLVRSPGEGKGYPLQYSGLENFHGLYSPWGGKELDMTK